MKEQKIRKGTKTIIQVGEMQGKTIPQLCYSNELKIVGVCRMCGVYKKEIEKIGMSCAEEKTRKTGEIIVEGEITKRHRKRVMKLQMTNHPLDCPVCDQGSECDLQETSYNTGEEKSVRTKEERTSLRKIRTSPVVRGTMTRCILCTRCVTWMGTKSSGKEIGNVGRGRRTEIGIYTNAESWIINTMSMTLVDICPVGAFTGNIEKYKYRGHHSKEKVKLEENEWARTAIVETRNAGIGKVRPLARREDNVLEVKTYYPVITDYSKLSKADMVEIGSTVNRYKPTLVESSRGSTKKEGSVERMTGKEIKRLGEKEGRENGIEYMKSESAKAEMLTRTKRTGNIRKGTKKQVEGLPENQVKKAQLSLISRNSTEVEMGKEMLTLKTSRKEGMAKTIINVASKEQYEQRKQEQTRTKVEKRIRKGKGQVRNEIERKQTLTKEERGETSVLQSKTIKQGNTGIRGVRLLKVVVNLELFRNIAYLIEKVEVVKELALRQTHLPIHSNVHSSRLDLGRGQILNWFSYILNKKS